MSEKLYTFHVPVTIHAVERVYVCAESEEEARELFKDQDWYDSGTDEQEREYEFDEAILDEVQEVEDDE